MQSGPGAHGLGSSPREWATRGTERLRGERQAIPDAPSSPGVGGPGQRRGSKRSQASRQKPESGRGRRAAAGRPGETYCGPWPHRPAAMLIPDPGAGARIPASGDGAAAPSPPVLRGSRADESNDARRPVHPVRADPHRPGGPGHLGCRVPGPARRGGLLDASGLGTPDELTLRLVVPLVVAVHFAYIGFVRLVERRPASELSGTGAVRRRAPVSQLAPVCRRPAWAQSRLSDTSR